MLTALGARVERVASEYDPFTNVYGLARTMLALATAATLVVNPVATSFRPAAGMPDAVQCTAIRAASVWCQMPNHLEWARWLSVLALLVVASGWRPRLTGILHFYVVFSFQASAALVEGGDQIASCLTALLVPITLADPRTWHWETRANVVLDEAEATRRLVARTFHALLRLQVAGIYFHASIAKFRVEEWNDGSAVYYWLTDPRFGLATWLEPLVRPALLAGPVVALVTWSVLVGEWALSAGLLVAKEHRPKLLALGFALHGGIALLHGLVSFAVIMMAALVLFLRPFEESFAMPESATRLTTFVRRELARRARAVRFVAARG